MMFGVLLVPTLYFIAVGVDYGRALSVQAALQTATDSTALMVGPNAKIYSAAQLQTVATQYLNAMLPSNIASGVTVTATATGTTNANINVTASGTLSSPFTSIMGYPTLPVKAATTVQAASSARQRVALVLDNSGSMSDSGKMTALRSAVTNFLQTLQAAVVNSADVYVSIIPFTNDVNVGTANVNANWIDWTDYNASSCYGGRSWGWSWGGSGCSSSNHSGWSGCVADRGNTNNPSSFNYDTNVTAPTTSDTGSLFPADDLSSGCPPLITPLTNNFTTLTTAVAALTPNGNTNQAIGLAHGWMSLVGGGPYAAPPVKDPAYTYQTTVILLSDGLNTYDRWYSNQSSIDARQNMTCANIKAAGITLYTIQVNTGGDPTSSILQTCASDASKFFLLTSSSQIISVFNTIGTQLNQLRLAK